MRTLWGVICSLYFDCGFGFTGVYISKYIRLCNWNMGSLFYVNFTLINLLKCLLDASPVSDNILHNGNTEINRTSQFESCSAEAYKISLCICKKWTVMVQPNKLTIICACTVTMRLAVCVLIPFYRWENWGSHR